MDASESVESDDGRHLVIETKCPECGAPSEAELWDYSGTCAFCNSLLVFGRDLEHEVFAVADPQSDAEDLVRILVASEASNYRSKLTAETQNRPHGVSLEIPAWVDAKVERFARRLREALELQLRVDFLVPYRITEKTVLQGILGRRSSGPKESYLQCFRTEDLQRRYDAGRYNLRDRGLKIRGFRLARLDASHLDVVKGRLLETAEAEAFPDGRAAFDRKDMRVDPDSQIIAKFTANWKERRLVVYKHFTYACFSRDRGERHYLFDQQFNTVAARLEPSEVDTYLRLVRRDLSEVLPKPEVRAIASECPNCGWEISFPRNEQISFCPECKHAVLVEPQGLRTVAYEAAPLPTPRKGQATLYYPFWAFPFRVRVSDRAYRNVWSWLEEVSPQPIAARLKQRDPSESRLFVPARNLHGARPLNDAFAHLTAWATWRQPETSRERPPPIQPLRMLGTEVTVAEARPLARFALVALHDVQSTRRLNGVNFRTFIAEAELDLANPKLTALPLVLQDDTWSPEGMRCGLPRPLLEGSGEVLRVVKSFNLY